MSSISEKLEIPKPTMPGRARAYLSQLESVWGQIEVLSSDDGGPIELLRHSMKTTRWRRVNIDRKGAVFEIVTEG